MFGSLAFAVWQTMVIPNETPNMTVMYKCETFCCRRTVFVRLMSLFYVMCSLDRSIDRLKNIYIYTYAHIITDNPFTLILNVSPQIIKLRGIFYY